MIDPSCIIGSKSEVQKSMLVSFQLLQKGSKIHGITIKMLMSGDVRVWQDILQIQTNFSRTVAVCSSDYPHSKKELGPRKAQKWLVTVTKKWQAHHCKGFCQSLICLAESKGKTKGTILLSKWGKHRRGRPVANRQCLHKSKEVQGRLETWVFHSFRVGKREHPSKSLIQVTVSLIY